MSRYLNDEQQERFNRIINDFDSERTSEQEGLTVKVGTTIVYRIGIDDKPNIDRIKPEELEKLEAAVNGLETAKGTVEIALYTPAKEEVFRYENGNVTIKKRGANQQSYESETDPLEAQLLNQQQDLQTDQQSQPEIGITEEINQQPTNQIYLDKDFGYLSTDYYLRDASSIFGEWAKQFTPNGVYLMSQMGLDWQYFADKYEQQKTGQELSAQQQQDWSQLSLTERLSAIRNQYGITQPNSGERQRQQYQERSR